MSAIRGSVKRALSSPFICQHVELWPVERRARMAAGIEYCPYCQVEVRDKHIEKVEALHTEASERFTEFRERAETSIKHLSETNVALQRFAMGCCDTQERATDLLRINREQYERLGESHESIAG